MFPMSVYSTVQMDEDVNMSPPWRGAAPGGRGRCTPQGPTCMQSAHYRLSSTLGREMEFMLSTTAEAFIFKLSCSNAEVSCRTAH